MNRTLKEFIEKIRAQKEEIERLKLALEKADVRRDAIEEYMQEIVAHMESCENCRHYIDYDRF